eukprot:scaffold1486_cov169-Ochromonas_danica.AAC.4
MEHSDVLEKKVRQDGGQGRGDFHGKRVAHPKIDFIYLNNIHQQAVGAVRIERSMIEAELDAAIDEEAAATRNGGI